MLAVLTGCGGGAASTTASTNVAPALSVSQPTAGQLTATIGAAYSLSLGSGGTAPFTWKVTSGTLPAGLTLNPSANAGSAVITGTPTNAAVDQTVTVQATDASNQSASVTLAFTVPIVITTGATLPNGEVSQAAYGSGPLVALGGSGTFTQWSVTGGALPNGLSISATTGTISGTPSAACSPCMFTVQVKDSAGATGTRQFSITINPEVTITSSGMLAGGTINTAYGPGTLTASNGVPPYSGWAVSSPTLPTGLSLSGMGVIFGTPSASGTFNFSVTVKDSLNVTSAPAALTIVIATVPLAITTTSLLPATVGTLYDQAIQTSGGDGTAITFAVASGTLPAWATLNTSTGHISGTPMAAGTSAVFTIGATQTGITVTSGSLTISAVPVGSNNSKLNGQYAFLLSGFGPAGTAFAMAGSFTADGAGNITSGSMDIGQGTSGSNFVTINPSGSFYSVGTDNRGQLTLNPSVGTAQTLDFSVGSISSGVASLGHIISRQNTSATNGSAIGGVFKKQDPTAFTFTVFNGDFALLEEGRDPRTGGRIAGAGRFTLMTTGNPNLSGVFDLNNAGTVVSNNAFTGLLGPVDPMTGRGQLTTSIPETEAVYIVSGNEAFFVTAGSTLNSLLAGSVLRQSTTFCPTTGACNFTNNALSGNAVVYIHSDSVPAGVSCSAAGASTVEVGVLTFTPGVTSSCTTGACISGGFDANACGTIGTPAQVPASGTYSVAANGRVTIPATTSNPHPVIPYLLDANRAFLIGTNTPRVEAGAVEPQQAGPFAFGPGANAFGTKAPAVSGELVFGGVQTVTATSTGYNASSNVEDINSIAGGLLETVAFPDFTAILDTTTGRFTFTDGQASNSSRVGYFINSSRRVVIPTDPTITTPWILLNDNQ